MAGFSSLIRPAGTFSHEWEKGIAAGSTFNPLLISGEGGAQRRVRSVQDARSYVAQLKKYCWASSSMRLIPVIADASVH